MIGPTPPFTPLSFRWSARIGRFLPCLDADPRGSMTTTVDALGRVVIADFAGNGFGRDRRLIGYTLAEESPLIDPADVRAYLTTSTRRK